MKVSDIGFETKKNHVRLAEIYTNMRKGGTFRDVISSQQQPMKRFLIIIISVGLLFSNVKAQGYKELVKEAYLSYHSKDFIKSERYFEKAFQFEQNNSLDLYNAACAAALANSKSNAFKWLNLSIKNGYTNINHLKKDKDFNSIRNDKKWNSIIENLQKKVDIIEANYDRPLQNELITIFNDDQIIRREYIEAGKKYGYEGKAADSLGKIMTHRDSLNLIKVEKILNERGWVGKDIVGAEANQTLFLVIQHSDLGVQQKYLPMMRDAVKAGNADAASLALLEDRIALREGRRQIYGSQIGTHPTTKKEYVLPLEDPENVDERRQKMGLGTFGDYVKYWNIIWNVESYKKELPELEELNGIKK